MKRTAIVLPSFHICPSRRVHFPWPAAWLDRSVACLAGKAIAILILAIGGMAMAQTPATQPTRISQDVVDAAMARLNARKAQKPTEAAAKSPSSPKKAAEPADAKPNTLSAIFDAIPPQLKPAKGATPTAAQKQALTKWFTDNFKLSPLSCDGWAAEVDEAREDRIILTVRSAVVVADGSSLKLACGAAFTDPAMRPAVKALKRGEEVHLTGQIDGISITWGTRPEIQTRLSSSQLNKPK